MPLQTTFPEWLKQDIPDPQKIHNLRKILEEFHIHSVCQEAHCPNLGQCWQNGCATFMILGDVCTRACRFCAVRSGDPKKVDEEEPKRIAQVIQRLDLQYVVITSVTRDDLADGGAGHFAKTIAAIREILCCTKVEVLIPDFNGDETSLKKVIGAHPDVLSHNMETVLRLSKILRPRADYYRSLEVLRTGRMLGPDILIKSGFMVGLGETQDEIKQLIRDLAKAGCDILTIGQYLAPSKSGRHVAVSRFVSPQEFDDYRKLALDLGFSYVASGPLVRSSYMAEQGYQASRVSRKS